MLPEHIGWLKHGVPIRFAGTVPPRYNLGASQTDTTEDEKLFLDLETHRLLELGAWEEVDASEVRCVNRVFLVPKAGSKKFRLVIDLRPMNVYGPLKAGKEKGAAGRESAPSGIRLRPPDSCPPRLGAGGK